MPAGDEDEQVVPFVEDDVAARLETSNRADLGIVAEPVRDLTVGRPVDTPARA